MEEKKSKYTLESAIERIKRNGGKVGVDDFGNKTVVLPHPGIKMLGCLDYLLHYQGYFEVAQ